MIWLINLILTLITVAILARAILSFVMPMVDRQRFSFLVTIDQFFFTVTEPLLAPIRRMLPSFGGLDLSPMVVIIVLIVIQRVLARL